MPGFITRKWTLDGQVVDEETYPSDHAYITKLQVQTEVNAYGMVFPLELELTFDPPVIQLNSDQARQLRQLLDTDDFENLTPDEFADPDED